MQVLGQRSVQAAGRRTTVRVQAAALEIPAGFKKVRTRRIAWCQWLPVHCQSTAVLQQFWTLRAAGGAQGRSRAGEGGRGGDKDTGWHPAASVCDQEAHIRCAAVRRVAFAHHQRSAAQRAQTRPVLRIVTLYPYELHNHAPCPIGPSHMQVMLLPWVTGALSMASSPST